MLLDLVLALTIILMMSAVVWPMLGRGTSGMQNAALALDIATLLRVDRSSAVEGGVATGTSFDLDRRVVADGAGRRIDVPRDITISVTTGVPCVVGPRRFVITFAIDGSSCGGEIRLSNGVQTHVVYVNWLSGMVDVIHVPGY